MYRLVPFALLCMLTHIYARQPADSIETLLKQHSARDTIRLNMLIELANIYSDENIVKGINTAEEAILLARQLQIPSKLGRAYFVKALNQMNNDAYAQALNTLTAAIAAYTTAKDTAYTGRCYFGMGLAYFNMSQYDSAIACHKKAQSLFAAIKDERRLANTMNSIAANYRNLGNYPQAIDYYLRALKIHEKNNNENDLAMTLSNIGMVYKDLGAYEKALPFHNRALAIYTSINDAAGAAKTLINTGIVYDMQKKPQAALEVYKKALGINDSLGIENETATCLHNIGIIYFEQDSLASAWHYFEKAYGIFSHGEDKRSTAIVLDYMGMLYRKAPASLLQQEGIRPKNRYTKALEYQLQALALATAAAAAGTRATILQDLSETYAAKEDYKNAFNTHRQYSLLKDSIFNDEKREDIARKGMQYEFEKKEALIKAANEKQQALAASQISRQRIIRNAVLVGAVILLLGAITSFIFYKRRRDAEASRSAAELKAEVADTEMKALRAQMNPHFIFNSLNSISDYILKNDMQSANTYLSKFARIMRMILEHSEQKEISLADDLRALELYIQLESARMQNGFAYTIEVAEDIDRENTLVPPLILQPFVENSIWHGLSKKQGAGMLTISISKEGNMLNCRVEDNGVGRNTASGSAAVEKKSLGMKITSARLDIINRLKRTNAGIRLTDLTEGTKVEVRLPLELSF